MSQQRAVISAFRLRQSISHPFALMRTARIGVVNRYKHVSLPANSALAYKQLISLNFSTFRTTLARTSTSSAR